MSANRNPQVFIDNIKGSLHAIEEYIGELTFEEYNLSGVTQDAINMRLQVIGENASKLPVKLRDQFPYVAWHKIRGLRNLISHDYYILDTRILWQIIHEELPILKKVLPVLEEQAS